jgi:hypothetical protein
MAEFGWSGKTAERFMQVYQEFGYSDKLSVTMRVAKVFENRQIDGFQTSAVHERLPVIWPRDGKFFRHHAALRYVCAIGWYLP